MMGKRNLSEQAQMEIASLEDLVPRSHLVRKLDEAIDLSFIYDLVKDLYTSFGREGIDPVVLIKIPMIQYLFDIPSMRKTTKEIEVNEAYRWYLGYGMSETVPHFSTFGKNYSRHFEGTGLFEEIFTRIFLEVDACGFLDTESLFIDGTHIKASSTPHKYRKETIERVFADAKEKHGMRYTQYSGLAKLKMELNLLFACMNLKKLAIWKWRKKWGAYYTSFSFHNPFNKEYSIFIIGGLTTKWFSGHCPRTILSTV